MKKKHGVVMVAVFLFIGVSCIDAVPIEGTEKTDEVVRSSPSLKNKKMKNSLALIKKKEPIKKDQKKAILSSRDQLEEAGAMLKKAVQYLTENAYFMADVEPGSEGLRILAVKIYKTEAYCTLKLANLDSYIEWEYPLNPFEDLDAYYDGIERFNKKGAAIFGNTLEHKTQRERSMVSLRGSIHENILSLIRNLNETFQILSVKDFKFGGHAYQDIDLDLHIDLYEKLSTKTVEWLDRSYQQWQVVFYRTLFFILKELAALSAQKYKDQGNGDVYFDLKAIGDSSKLTIEKIKKSFPEAL